MSKLACGHPEACIVWDGRQDDDGTIYTECSCCADIARAVEAEREAWQSIAWKVENYLRNLATSACPLHERVGLRMFSDEIAEAIRARGSK